MILNRQAALDRIEHDNELYDEICGIFRDDVPKIVDQLKEALNCCDIPVATRHAHSIKSAAANIGATDLNETARLAENALRTGSLENIHSLISEIDQNISRVLKELE
jgi:HPt (histidine-containing phosphotransfer) domain-containing protein